MFRSGTETVADPGKLVQLHPSSKPVFVISGQLRLQSAKILPPLPASAISCSIPEDGSPVAESLPGNNAAQVVAPAGTGAVARTADEAQRMQAHDSLHDNKRADADFPAAHDDVTRHQARAQPGTIAAAPCLLLPADDEVQVYEVVGRKPARALLLPPLEQWPERVLAVLTAYRQSAAEQFGTSPSVVAAANPAVHRYHAVHLPAAPIKHRSATGGLSTHSTPVSSNKPINVSKTLNTRSTLYTSSVASSVSNLAVQSINPLPRLSVLSHGLWNAAHLQALSRTTAGGSSDSAAGSRYQPTAIQRSDERTDDNRNSSNGE